MSKVTNWLVNELPKYWKTVVALAPVVIFVGNEVMQALGATDGSLTPGDIFRIATVAVVSYGVYKKQNKKPQEG